MVLNKIITNLATKHKDIVNFSLYLWTDKLILLKNKVRFVSNKPIISTTELMARRQGKLLRSHSFDGNSFTLSSRESRFISAHKRLVKLYNEVVLNNINMSPALRQYGYGFLNDSFILMETIAKKHKGLIEYKVSDITKMDRISSVTETVFRGLMDSSIPSSEKLLLEHRVFSFGHIRDRFMIYKSHLADMVTLTGINPRDALYTLTGGFFTYTATRRLTNVPESANLSNPVLAMVISSENESSSGSSSESESESSFSDDDYSVNIPLTHDQQLIASVARERMSINDMNYLNDLDYSSSIIICVMVICIFGSVS